MNTRVLPLLALRFRQEILELSGTWWFLLTLVMQAVLGPLIGLAVWSAIYPDNPVIGRYYVAVTLVTLMTESFEQHTFSSRIYDGTISHELLRPQPVVISVLGTNIAMRCWLTMVGAPLVLIVSGTVGVTIGWQAIAMSIPSVILGATLAFLWTFLLSMTAFWTNQVHGIVGFGSYLIFLLSGTAAPITFLPGPWHRVAEILPFYGMIGLPAEIVVGQPHGASIPHSMLYQLGWVVIFVATVIMLWRAGVRHFTAVGS